MQKDLEEFIEDHQQIINISNSVCVEMVSRIDLEKLDGKIKTKRDELLIELGELLMNYDKSGIIEPAKHTDLINKLKELEDENKA